MWLTNVYMSLPWLTGYLKELLLLLPIYPDSTYICLGRLLLGQLVFQPFSLFSLEFLLVGRFDSQKLRSFTLLFVAVLLRHVFPECCLATTNQHPSIFDMCCV